MALTSISFVFLSLFAIHQVEATFEPSPIPALALTCNEADFDLTVTYAQTASADYSQSNDLQIGDDAGCAETGTSVDNTADVPVTKSGLSYGDSATAGCGAGATYDEASTPSVYNAPVTVTVKVTKSNIERTYTYTYEITCTLGDRTKGVSGTASFTVTNVETPGVDATGQTFDLGVTLGFVESVGGAAIDGNPTIDSTANLYIAVSESSASSELKFTVQRCFASTSADASNTDVIADIIDGECPTDSSVTLEAATPAVPGTSSYTITTKAFTITGGSGSALYIHCNVFVCLESEVGGVHGGKCVQNTDECTKKRKRRSAVDVDEQLRGETITSVQTFTIIDDAYTTDCPEGHVFDTLSKLCTQERVFKIEGVHLDKQWEPEYANSSSTKFKWFAKNTAREIRALMLATGVERQIRGIKVIAARPGSVILTVLITYGEEVEPREGFEIFRNMLWHTTPQVSRLVNVLKVIKEKTVELVPVEIGSKSLDKNFIIVVVFAVVAVLFISAITLYQVQKIRRTPPVTGVTGIDNSAMEKA